LNNFGLPIPYCISVDRLEKRSDALKEENTMLKKAEANNKELEEQCAKLKRRNAELANNVKVTKLC